MLMLLETAKQVHPWEESTLAFLGATAKLCTPFLFALLLIWAKEYIVARRERQQIQDALWSIMLQGRSKIADPFDITEEIAQAYERDELSSRITYTIQTHIPYIRRLTQLDREHAYVYSEYEIELEGLSERDQALNNVREQYCKEPDEDNRKKLARAIRQHCEAAREQDIQALGRELDVLKTLQKARKRKRSEQDVKQFEDALRDIERKETSRKSERDKKASRESES